MEHFSVIVSEKAKQQLAQHIAFLAKVDKKAAKELKNLFISSLKSLEQFPMRFPFLQTEFIPQNRYCKMPVNKHYVIIYQVVEKTVFITYILDCRQDYTWLLEA